MCDRSRAARNCQFLERLDVRENPCRGKASIFHNLRAAILSRYPTITKLVQQRFPGNPAGEEAFAYALELFLRLIPNLDISLDGWKLFRLVSETATSLRAVGIAYVLPDGELPVEVTLSTCLPGIRYGLQQGVPDSQWNSLSAAKRWKAVYLYASGERDREWGWSKPISGCLDYGHPPTPDETGVSALSRRTWRSEVGR
jgi:hypothetical protein